MADHLQDPPVVQPLPPVGVTPATWSQRLSGTWRPGAGLTLFFVLVVTQLGHVGEHAAQMFQIHGLHREAGNAHGIIGALDVEWVHFAWNTWVLLAVLLLVARFPRNRWLWLALAAAGWHQVEHIHILAVYLTTGTPGAPGLLAAGGAIAGGTFLPRPELHFLYNLVETVPILLGFVRQGSEARRPRQGVRWTLAAVSTRPRAEAPLVRP